MDVSQITIFGEFESFGNFGFTPTRPCTVKAFLIYIEFTTRIEE